MWKLINKELKATLLLIAVFQLVSGATVRHGKRQISTLQRDQLMAQSFSDMGATMKCLLQLDRPEIYDKINKVWIDQFDRIQSHPTKPLNPDNSMDVLYKKGNEALQQLQSIDEKCSRVPYTCHNDGGHNPSNTIPKDLKDMANNLQNLAITIQCVLKQTSDQDQLHLIFDNSFERMHSNYDPVPLNSSKFHEEILLITTEIAQLSEKCRDVQVQETACLQ